LAPNAAWRAAIVPPPPEEDDQGHEAQREEEGSGPRPRYIRWARLLKRVFAIDITTCPHCAGSLKIVAATTDPPVIRKILTAMGLSPHPPPRSPARDDSQAEATLY
jgi:hypothetical protein